MSPRQYRRSIVCAAAIWLSASVTFGQTSTVEGTVRDETGGALPGVSVELRGGAAPALTVTDGQGRYRIDAVAPGRYQVTFTLINFAITRRDATVVSGGTARVDAAMHLSLSADVTVTGKRTFANLADAERPAEDLVGIAQSSSQGAITARQLEARPVMRTGEVLETIPGVVISQHSGEGKANQYYLRGFNLDHGTDFATTVAGMPVNMPTHAHGHGYSDLNFMMPELVSGVQFSKGPYFADQGDFATAGAASISYVNALNGPIARVSGGGEGFARVFAAASPALGRGHVLAAIELEHNDGPWARADNYRKVNGVARYSQGDAVNGFSLTGMAYRSTWNSTDQIPQRAVADGLIDRFGTLDPSDGGDTYRYSGSFEWQRTRGNAATKVTAYGIGYDVNLFSNFTFFLDDPVRGDQFHQTDHRFISGVRISYRRLDRWADREVQNTAGVHVRNDDIAKVGLSHTENRHELETIRQDAVMEANGAVYAQNEIAWSPWFRTLAGIRADAYRFNVDASDPANGGTVTATLASPKGGVVLGPWRGTEFYVNAGYGYHSNDARGATITRDPSTGTPADRVTPLVRARGAELGVRTVALRHLQTSLTAWRLDLESELIFAGDAGTTEASRPSHRAGVELANYFTPRPWIILDGDVSWSRARFATADPVGDRIPGSVETVVSAGVTMDSVHNVFGSVRLRYFGPRPLLEDDSVRSKPTALLNAEVGYMLSKHVKVAADILNLLNAKDSDIDYYYTSRLPGEPADGIGDIHVHPTLPRTARVSLILAF